MRLESVKKLLKDPIGVGLYFLFEKWRTKDGRRILSTNVYKRLAKAINRQKYAKFKIKRDAFLKNFLSNHHFEYPENFMKDGWTLFDDKYFPYTEEVVKAGQAIYEKKGEDKSRVFMPYPIAYFDELLDIDVFYKFAFSEKMIAHAAEYLGEYPVLTNIDLVRSDPRERDEWLESQQLHLDVIDTRVFRVIVYITDVDSNNGPFSFFPLSVSEKMKKDKKLNYGAPLTSMNIEDSRLGDYSNDDLIQVKGKSGSVLTVDTCNCFHYGSRAESESRCVLMLSFTSSSLENLRERMQLDLIPESDSMEPEYIKLVKNREFMPSHDMTA